MALHSSGWPSTNPGLPFELVLPILTTAIRCLKPSRSVDLMHLTAVLNVVSRSSAPELSYALIMATPWIDTNHACKVGSIWLLDVLHERLTKPPYSRPLSYFSAKALSNATRYGHVHVLQWWSEHVNMRQVDAGNYIALATKHNQLDAMNWWVSDAAGGSPFGHGDVKPINEAQSVEVLDWHVTHFESQLNARVHWIGASFLRAIRQLVGQGQEEQHAVVEWWMGPAAAALNLPKCYYEIAMVTVIAQHAQRRHELPATLDLLARLFTLYTIATPKFGPSASPCPTPDHFATFACYSGDLELVQWCLEHLGNKIYASWAYSFASGSGHVHVLDWLQIQGYRYTGFEEISNDGRPDYLPHNLFLSCNRCSLDHLKGHFWSIWEDKHHCGYSPQWMSLPLSPIEMACAKGHVQVLEWLWRWDKELFESTAIAEKALTCACANGHTCAAEWWDSRGFPLKLNVSMLHEATAGGHEAVISWLLSQQPLVDLLTMMLLDDQRPFIRELIRNLIWSKEMTLTKKIQVVEWWRNWVVLTPECSTELFMNMLWANTSRAACLELLDHFWHICGYRPTTLHIEALNHPWHVIEVSQWMLQGTCHVGSVMDTRRAFEILYWWLDHAPELVQQLDYTNSPVALMPLRSGDVLYLEEWFKVGLLRLGLTWDVGPCQAVASLEWAVRYNRVRIDTYPPRLSTALSFAFRKRRWEVRDWWLTSGLLSVSVTW